MEVLVAQLVVYKLCTLSLLNCIDILEMQCKQQTATVDLAVTSNTGIKPSLIWEDSI